MANGQYKTIAVGPHRILGIEPQEVLPETVCDRGHRHRCSWVSGVGRLHAVHRESANRVDAGRCYVLLQQRDRGGSRYTHQEYFRRNLPITCGVRAAGRGGVLDPTTLTSGQFILIYASTSTR